MEIDDVLEMLKERAELHNKVKQGCKYDSKLYLFHEGAMIALTSMKSMIEVKLSKEER